jgi:hypothetical protein
VQVVNGVAQTQLVMLTHVLRLVKVMLTAMVQSMFPTFLRLLLHGDQATLMQISTVMALSMSLTSFWQFLHGDHARDSYMNFYKGLCILQSPFFTLR